MLENNKLLMKIVMMNMYGWCMGPKVSFSTSTPNLERDQVTEESGIFWFAPSTILILNQVPSVISMLLLAPEPMSQTSSWPSLSKMDTPLTQSSESATFTSAAG